MSNYIYVVTIFLDVPLYLTDMHRNYSYNGHNFIAGKLKINNAVIQKSQPSANDFSMLLSAVDQTLVSAFTSSNYKGRRCLIERITLNDDETINSVETWLDGDLNKYSYANTLKESVIKLSVGSIFAAFESIKMLNLGVQFADSINVDETLYWGKATPDAPVDLKGTAAKLISDVANLVTAP